MTNYQEIFTRKLSLLTEKNNYRYFLHVNKSARHFPNFYFDHEGETRRAINFCSNDYLGMSVEEDVISRQSFILHQSGTGSGGTRNISGTTNHHRQLELLLATWHQKEAALLFSSAYMANLTALQTIGRHIPGLVFISDERNHASLIEGMRAAGNRKLIFRHNDVAHLEEILAGLDPATPRVVVFESVYSMNGSIAPIADISLLAKKYNALTYVDEVHAVGLYGGTGAGIAEEMKVTEGVDIINGTLAKAAGVIGGYVAASATIIDFLRSYGSGFIFTTSLPPAVCAAAEKSVTILRTQPQFRNTMHGLVTYLRRLLANEGINFTHNPSHITVIPVGDAALCKSIADTLLLKHGMYVQPVNAPTVPEGEECLRVIVTARHTRAHVLDFVNKLKQVLDEYRPDSLQAKPSQSVTG